MSFVLQQNVVGREAAAPITYDRRRRSLSVIAKRHADSTRPHIVSVHRRAAGYAANDDTVKLRGEWRKTLIGADDVVLITYLPLGNSMGGGGAKSIGTALAMVALTALAPWAVGAAGISALGGVGSLTVMGKIVAGGLIVGGGMLLSLASQGKADGKDRPLYSVAGNANTPRPGDRIPRVYGKRWTTPDLAQPDYSIYDGDKQRLYKRMVLTLGKCQVHEIRLGELVVWTSSQGVTDAFPGTLVEIIQPGQASALVPSDVISSPSVIGQEPVRPESQATWTGPYPVTPAGVTCNKIQVDFTFPNGVFKTTSEQKEIPVNITWQYAPIDAAGNETGPWQTLVQYSRTMLRTRPLRETRIIDVPEGRYAVRARNNQSSNEHWTDTVLWEALRGHRKDIRVRDFCTELGMMIPAGKDLQNTQFQEVQVLITAIVPVWDGFQWVDMPTRKAVWAYADIMRNEVYGGAMPDRRFDAEICRYYANLLSEFDTFDGEIRGPDSVYNAAATVLGVMRSEPSYLGNIWSMVRDEPKALARHIFTGKNILKGSSEVTYITQADDGSAHFILEYDIDGDPKRPDEVEAYYGNPSLTPTRIRITGVSDYNHAMHLCRWMAATGFYRRRKKTFSVEHEGAILQRGDRALVDVHFMEATDVTTFVSRAGLLVRVADPIVAGPALNLSSTGTVARASKQITMPTGGALSIEIDIDASEVTNTALLNFQQGSAGSNGNYGSVNLPSAGFKGTWSFTMTRGQANPWFSLRLAEGGKKVRVTRLSIKSGGVELNTGGVLQAGWTFAGGGALSFDEATHATIRRRDGTEWGPVAVTSHAVDPNLIILNEADAGQVEAATGQPFASCFSTDFEDDTTIVIGRLGTLTHTDLVREVRATARDRHQVSVVNDNPEVWAAIGAAVPTRPPLPSANEIPLRPIVSGLSASIVQDQTTLVVKYQIGPAAGATAYTVEISQDNEQTWAEIHDGSASIQGQGPVIYDPDNPIVRIRAAAIGRTGIPGPYFTAQAITFKPIIVADEVGEGAVDWPALSEGVGQSLTMTYSRIRELLEEVRDLAFQTSDQGLSTYAIINRQNRSLSAKIVGAEARFEEAIAVAVGPGSALVQLITELEATVFDPVTGVPSKASITSVDQVQVSLGQLGETVASQAVSINSLSTTVGQNTASISQILESTDGIGLRYGVVGNINGQTGGFVLTGIQRLDGTVQFTLEIMGDVIVDGSISAIKLSVSTLSAISADVGLLTAGLIRDANSKLQIQLNSGRIVIYD